MPRKRRSVDVGGGVTWAVDSMAADFSLREMRTIVIGDDIEPEPVSMRLEATEVGMPSVVAEVERSANGDDSFDTSRRE